MKKKIPGYENYIIFDTGDVLNTDTNKMLEGTIRLHGYKVFRLSKNGVKKGFYAHRLVAENFLDNPNNYKVVNHIDGNKLNNDVSNLEWCSQSENMKHAHDTNLIAARKKKIEYIEDLPNEVWKNIKDFPLYKISNYGRVRNINSNRILRPSVVCGYYKVRLSNNGKIHDFLVHYLVQEIFNNQLPRDNECIDHIDGNKLNNHADNLRIVSLSENSLLAFYQQGLTSTCKAVDQCSLDGKVIATFPSARAAGRSLNLDSSSIIKVCKKKVKTCGGFIFNYH